MLRTAHHTGWSIGSKSSSTFVVVFDWRHATLGKIDITGGDLENLLLFIRQWAENLLYSIDDLFQNKELQ